MLRRIGELYAIEAEVRGESPMVRQRVRQERAQPLLDSLERWLRDRLLTLSLQSDTTKAINYMLNQWKALNYYCENGVAEIDNNIVENALRGVSLGRNNAQPQIMRSLRCTGRHDRPCGARCVDRWVGANCT